MMAYATEELWFSEWENGGTPWDHPEEIERFNPAAHVGDWKVPMLVIHSAKDYRIPAEQGIAAFTALQRRGIPSEFLYFPGREPLGAQAPEQSPVARHGRALDKEVDQPVARASLRQVQPR